MNPLRPSLAARPLDASLQPRRAVTPRAALGLVAGLPLLVAALASAGLVQAGAAIGLLLLAPVCEELVFRAGLQQQLLQRGWRPAAAVGITAAAFALLHGLNRSPALGLAVLAPALLLGALYQRRRSWPACAALHAGMNLAWLLATGPAATAGVSTAAAVAAAAVATALATAVAAAVAARH